MYRIDNATAVLSLPTPAAPGPNPNGYFQQLQTIIDGDWANAVQEEICYVIESTGATLDKNDRTQLLGALNAIIATYNSAGLSTALDVLTYAIISTVGDITITPSTGIVNVQGSLIVDNQVLCASDLTTNITFGAGTITFNCGGNTIADLNSSGMKLYGPGGIGARVNMFDNDTTMAANSATRLPTQLAVKTYVDAHTFTKKSDLRGFNSQGLAAGVTKYFAIGNGTASAPGGSADTYVYCFMVPFTGTLTGLYLVSDVAPGAAKTYIGTLYKNGSSTALTCTITGASTYSAFDTTNTVSVTAGDYITLEVVVGAAAATTNVLTWSVTLTG